MPLNAADFAENVFPGVPNDLLITFYNNNGCLYAYLFVRIMNVINLLINEMRVHVSLTWFSKRMA